MPKKNVYVDDDTDEWIRSHPDVSISKVFQDAIKKVMTGEDREPDQVAKVRRARIRGGSVALRPGERIVNVQDTGERVMAVVVSDGG